MTTDANGIALEDVSDSAPLHVPADTPFIAHLADAYLTVTGEEAKTISIGGGTMKLTDGSNANTQSLISAPIAGCYMSGVGNPGANTVAVEYAAIVTPLSSAVTNANIANVVFVIEWDT